MRVLFLAMVVMFAVACSSDTPATTVPTPVPPTATVSDPYIPPTPAPPFTPMPPATASSGLSSVLATVKAEATTTANRNATVIADLQSTISVPLPTQVVIVEELTDEDLDEWMCLERVSGTGTNPPEKIAGVTIVHEGVYWQAFDCNRFVE